MSASAFANYPTGYNYRVKRKSATVCRKNASEALHKKVIKCYYTAYDWKKLSLPNRDGMVFRLDALALSVIATETWLAGWLGGWVAVCHSRYSIKTTKRI